mgnify:CR=1 FL=1
MSFSSEVKSELCKMRHTKSCCLTAECAGMLLFSRNLSDEKISFYTDYSDVAEHLCYLLKKRMKVVLKAHIINIKNTLILIQKLQLHLLITLKLMNV